MTAMDFAKFARDFIDIFCWVNFAVMTVAAALYAAGQTATKSSNAHGISFLISGVGMAAWYFLRPTF